MTRNDRQDPETRSRPGRTHGEPRQTRSVRFSVSEWTLIEQAAERYGLAAGELVRCGALAFAENRLDNPPASSSSGHIALIEDSRITAFDGETVTFRHRKPAEPGRGSPAMAP